jgi:hypothetical protein
MSINDDSSRHAPPSNFNAISATEDHPPPAIDTAKRNVRRKTGKAPSRKEIKQKPWADIEARYIASARDKETVCAWMAYQAALKACKGWPAGSFDELLAEGYEYALSKWGDYDPTKASKNGISGFLYKNTFGHMRKVAHNLFIFHGKRKHRATDVIPTVSVVANVEDKPRGVVTVPRDSETYYGVGYKPSKEIYDSVSGLLTPKHIINAANRKSFKRDYVKSPVGLNDKQLTRLARIAAEIHVNQLLSELPADDRGIITQHWGLDGVESATLDELAERSQCSEATMRRKLDTLYIELKSLATQSKQV